MTRFRVLGRAVSLGVGLLLETWLAAAPAGAQETPLAAGETIRVQLGSQVAGTLGVPTPMEAVFIMVREDALVASSPYYGRIAVPLSAVESIRVQRTRSRSHALLKGGIAGAAFAVGMWQFLEVLCRDACSGGIKSAWFPATVSGVFVGGLVAGQGPGTRWVDATLPPPERAPGGVLFSLPVPVR